MTPDDELTRRLKQARQPPSPIAQAMLAADRQAAAAEAHQLRMRMLQVEASAPTAAVLVSQLTPGPDGLITHEDIDKVSAQALMVGKRLLQRAGLVDPDPPPEQDEDGANS